VIFVDTSAWFAVVRSEDPASIRAAHWFKTNTELLVTSDYVVDELLTLLRRRREYRLAIETGIRLFSRRLAKVEYVTVDDVAAAWEMFQHYRDKDWSFTDCTSFVLMQRLGIRTAFALDHHFEQHGKFAVVP
jgi:hypothetical protein